jgi:hypothetical protein
MRKWLLLTRLARLLSAQRRLEDRLDRLLVRIRRVRGQLGIATPAVEDARELETPSRMTKGRCG